VIYTSGSTGRPKAVQLCHQGVVNFLKSMAIAPGMTAEDHLLSVTTLSFDIAALEIFLPLSLGATVTIASASMVRDPEAILAQLADATTVMQATPSTWKMLLAVGVKSLGKVKVLTGGESLEAETASQLTSIAANVWNLYGPTETTIWSSIEFVSQHGLPVTIGTPVANTQIYILDSHHEVLPIGVWGEVFIAGDGLARGYLGQPGATAERFVPDPFGRPGCRMYKTGDVGRFGKDGRIHCRGRVDCQIKLRGHRIELGEIEFVGRQFPDVQEFVVVAQDIGSDGAMLAGFLVSAVGKKVEAETFKGFLSERLPDYMMPARLHLVDKLPMTPNGKIDRNALSAHPPEENGPAQIVDGPGTDLEERVAAIWRNILALKQIGREQNLFDLGGHSLLLLRARTALQAELKREIPVLDLFRYPTVRSLATHLSRTATHAGDDGWSEAACRGARQRGRLRKGGVKAQ